MRCCPTVEVNAMDSRSAFNGLTIELTYTVIYDKIAAKAKARLGHD
jgi:hypothetical protein